MVIICDKMVSYFIGPPTSMLKYPVHTHLVVNGQTLVHAGFACACATLMVTLIKDTANNLMLFDRCVCVCPNNPSAPICLLWHCVCVCVRKTQMYSKRHECHFGIPVEEVDDGGVQYGISNSVHALPYRGMCIKLSHAEGEGGDEEHQDHQPPNNDAIIPIIRN